MRLLLAMAVLGAAGSQARAEDSCAFLERQTQAFSDAGQRGEGAAMARMLDPEVIFFNETGERATRADMASTTPPEAGTPIRAILTTDWNCRVFGEVAVTSFVDVLEPGKPGEMKFRSVETWKRRGAVWRMIGSETLSLSQDPEAVTLDRQALEQYVGRYQAATGMTFVFARRDDGLVASLNGGTETAQKAQARDIFFTPGHGSTPKIFQRGDDGRITGFMLLRGRNSILFKRVA